jgi:hypothetical protein
MSRVDSRNFLTINPVQPDINPVASQPDYNQAQFIGGGVQLGEVAKNVGPSGEAALYGALAEIAGGVQKGINIFSDISSQIEKEKISKAEIEFDKIDQSNLSPEEKFSQLDSVLETIRTPVLGTSWQERFSLQASKKWLSDEGRDAFEEKRYRKEFVEFLNRKENLDRGASPELMEVFHNEYLTRHPTAQNNDWFRIKTFENKSNLIKFQVDAALTNLGVSVESAYRVPTQEQLAEIISGNPELNEEFKVFQELSNQARMAPNLETFNKFMLDRMQKDLIDGLSSDTPKDVYLALAKSLPEIAAKKAEQIFSRAVDMQRAEVEKTRLNQLIIGETSFTTATNKLEALPEYISSWVHLQFVSAPLDKKQSTVTKAVETLYSELTNERQSTYLESRFPGWGDKTAHEKAMDVYGLLEDWAKKNPQAVEKINSAIGGNFLDVAKVSLLKSKVVQEDFKRDFSNRVQNFGTRIKNFSVISDLTTLDKQKEEILGDIEKYTGISKERIKELSNYGSVTEWHDNLTSDEKKILGERGFDSDNFDSMATLQNVYLELTGQVTQQQNRIQSGKDSDRKNYELNPSNINSSASFSPQNKEGKPTYDISIVNGTQYTTDSNQPFNALMDEYIYRRDLAISNPKNQENLQTLRDMENANPQLPDFFRMGQQTRAALTDVGMTIPNPSGKKEPVEPLLRKSADAANDIVSGKRKANFESRPTNIVNSDGSWSDAARTNFIAISYLAKRSVEPDATAESQGWLKVQFETVLDRIGEGSQNSNIDYWGSEQAKYDLTALALLAREYKRASDSGNVAIFKGADALSTRAILAGNWAEETNPEDMLRALNDPKRTEEINQLKILIGGLAENHLRTRNLPAVGETMQGQQLVLSDKTPLEVASAFGFQPRQTATGFLVAGAKPTDVNWKPELLVVALAKAGLGDVNTKTLADVMRKRLIETIDPFIAMTLSDAEVIKNGAIILQDVYERDPNKLIMTLGVIFNPSNGINNPKLNIKPEEKLNFFFELLETSLDVDNYPVVSNAQRKDKIGISPVNGFRAVDGFKRVEVNGEEQTEMMITSIQSIQGDSDSNSYTNTAPFFLAEKNVFAGNYSQTTTQLERTYPPEQLKDGSTRNGTMWRVGSYVLDSPPVKDTRTLFDLVRPWAEQHGIYKVEDIFLPDSYTAPTNNTVQRNIAKQTLKKMLDTGSSDFSKTQSLHGWLETFHNIHKASGGSTLLLNEREFSRFRSRERGTSTLVQNPVNTLSRESGLPTWSFSNVDMQGRPFVIITDSYFFNPFERERKLKNDFNFTKFNPPPRGLSPHTFWGSPI